MAQLKEYTNTENVNPSTFEGTAYSLERYGKIAQENIEKGAEGLASAASAVEKHQARMDLSTFQTNEAQFNEDQMAKWDQEKQFEDPTDPQAAQKRIDAYREGMAKFTDNITNEDVQALAKEKVAQRTGEFARTVYGERAQLQVQLLHDNRMKADNSAANVLYSHPENLETEIGHTDAVVAGLPFASRGESARIRNATLADSAGRGLADRMLTADPRSLTEAQLQATIRIIGNPDGVFAKNMSTAKHDEVLKDLQQRLEKLPYLQDAADEHDDRVQAKAAAQFAAEIYGSTQDANGNNIIPPDYGEKLEQLKNMEGSTMAQYEALQNRRTSIQQGSLVVTDPDAWDAMSEIAKLPPTDPRSQSFEDRVLTLNHYRKISDADTSRLLRMQKQAQNSIQYRHALGDVKEFLRKEKTFFPDRDPILGLPDPTARDRYQQYTVRVMDRFQQLFDQGGDWAAGLRPDNVNYYGQFRDTYSLTHKGATSPFVTPTVQNSPEAPHIKDENDPAFKALQPNQLFFGPDGKPYWKK